MSNANPQLRPKASLITDPNGIYTANVNSSGQLEVAATVSGGGLSDVNVAKWDSVALGAPTTWGTAPSGIVIGGNVELFAGNSALVADGSNYLKVNVATVGPVVSVVSPTSTAASSPSAQTVTSGSGSILASNASRKECIIVNTSTVVVYLGLGQTPTSSNYHVALSACAAANDGTGGTYVSDMWKGAINAIVASTSGTVCVTELT